jgi:hypothetical protein
MLERSSPLFHKRKRTLAGTSTFNSTTQQLVRQLHTAHAQRMRFANARPSRSLEHVPRQTTRNVEVGAISTNGRHVDVDIGMLVIIVL